MSTEKKRTHVAIDFLKPVLVSMHGVDLVSSKISFREMEVQLYESSSQNPERSTIRVVNQIGFLCEVNRKDISAIYEGGKNIWNKHHQGITG